jgi:DNA repair protein RAD16
MRQAVDHPSLIVYSQKNIDKRREQAANGSVEQVANGSVECDICHEPPTERVLSSCCGAGLCRSCVIEYLTGTGGENTPCPSCQTPFSIDLNQASVEDTVDDGILTIAPADKSNGADRSDSFAVPSLKELPHVATGSILRRINLAEYATSTKIEALVQELIEMRQKRPGSKALVFSQFVNMLDLIRWRLHSDPCLAKMGLGVRILHGGMNVKNRDQTLKDFREDNGCRVLLMSLKAGGVALNLTVASEVFLVDNWWNPAAEMQAIDRTHRLGQYRPIRAVRFIAEGTVEERVLQL